MKHHIFQFLLYESHWNKSSPTQGCSIWNDIEQVTLIITGKMGSLILITKLLCANEDVRFNVPFILWTIIVLINDTKSTWSYSYLCGYIKMIIFNITRQYYSLLIYRDYLLIPQIAELPLLLIRHYSSPVLKRNHVADI